MFKTVGIEETIDNDEYEDIGYAIFQDGKLMEIRDEYLDVVQAHAEIEYGDEKQLVEIKDAYFKTPDAEQRFGVTIWDNK